MIPNDGLMIKTYKQIHKKAPNKNKFQVYTTKTTIFVGGIQPVSFYSDPKRHLDFADPVALRPLPHGQSSPDALVEQTTRMVIFI